MIKKIIYSTFLLILLPALCFAEHRFQTDSTWYASIPDNPVLESNSTSWINFFYTKLTGGFGADEGFRIYRADSGTPLREVQMWWGQKYCSVHTSTSCSRDAQCPSGETCSVCQSTPDLTWQVPIADGWRSYQEDRYCTGNYVDANMNVFDYIGHNITTGVVDGIPKQIHLYNARKCSVNSGNNCNSWPSGVPVDGEPWITKTSQWMPFTGDGITSCGETEGGGYLTSVACVNHSIAVITLDEYNAWKAGGEIAGIGIDHALDLTAPQSRGPYHCNHRYPSPGGLGQAETTSPLYPGNEACCHNCGGTSLDPGVDTGPELGIRLQILPTYNCNQHADLTKAICQAWQKYGAIYTEHTSAHDMYINIESVLPPRSWYGAHYEGLPKNWLNYMRIVLPVCIIGTECNTANDGGAAICSGSNQNFNCITGGIDSQNPTTPRSPQAQAHATQAEVTISWIASTDNVAVDHYNIYWCSGVDCTPTTLISPIVYPDTSYVHNGLTSATLYRYQIEAVDTSDNKSDKTAIIEATTPTPSAPDYTLKKKGQVITIDGNCNEYAYANTLTVTPAAGGNIATVYLLWDEVNGDLYGCADIQDTDLQCSVQPRDGLYYVNDAIAFSFDTANDKGSANDNDDYKFAIDLAGIQSDSRQLNVGWSTTWLSAVAYAGTLNDAIPDVGWSAEWKISYADWGVSVPEVDDVYGMEVELWDKDGY